MDADEQLSEAINRYGNENGQNDTVGILIFSLVTLIIRHHEKLKAENEVK